jgi:hypothetical protein
VSWPTDGQPRFKPVAMINIYAAIHEAVHDVGYDLTPDVRSHRAASKRLSRFTLPPTWVRQPERLLGPSTVLYRGDERVSAAPRRPPTALPPATLTNPTDAARAREERC